MSFKFPISAPQLDGVHVTRCKGNTRIVFRAMSKEGFITSFSSFSLSSSNSLFRYLFIVRLFIIIFVFDVNNCSGENGVDTLSVSGIGTNR